jgi:hypothetical protein
MLVAEWSSAIWQALQVGRGLSNQGHEFSRTCVVLLLIHNSAWAFVTDASLLAGAVIIACCAVDIGGDIFT